jgi:hypothetical protein
MTPEPLGKDEREAAASSSQAAEHARGVTAGKEPAMPQGRLERLFRLADGDRPPGLLALSLLSIFAAGATAIVLAYQSGGQLFCTVTKRLSGSDIEVAAYVVMSVCFVAFVVSILVRAMPRLFALNLFFAAIALLSGILLVASDSAVSRSVQSCSLIGPAYTSTVSNHVSYVYVVWGIATGILLLQLRRAIHMPTGPFRAGGPPPELRDLASLVGHQGVEGAADD